MVREKLTVEGRASVSGLMCSSLTSLKILAITQHKAVNVIMEEAVEDLMNKYQGKKK